MKLSVIIPIYKVEDTLDRCVESVLGQNIDEMEVILVDDGSPDRCPEMCDEWAKKDARIKVIHKKNGGLSDARNAGLDIANGDYITFVDSDDYLVQNTYQYLMEVLKGHKDVDIIEFPVKQEDPRRHELQLENRIFSIPEDYWLTTKAWLHAYACNKIYSRKVFEKSRYAKGRIFEDLLILPRLLKQCGKIATINVGTYVYTLNKDGISKRVNVKSVFSMLRADIEAAYAMKTLPWNKNGKNLYYYMCCWIYDIIRLSLGIKIQ